MLCAHIQIGTTPFETLFVLEEHLGLASGLVRRIIGETCHATVAGYRRVRSVNARR